MARSLFSASWYRVADLRPRLRSHAQMHRQSFRGQVWYVLLDPQTGRSLRLSPAAHYLMCLMNGRRTLNEIWETVGRRLGTEQPTQDETIRMLTQLHRSDLLHGEQPPDMDELARRSHDQKVRNLLLRLRNPMALRFPLFDPDRFLAATLPFVRPVFGVAGFLAWLALVCCGVVLAVLHWPALTNDVFDLVFTAENVVLLLLTYPFVKALHELGHGYATRIWGGEVHEIGIMFLVLMPVPYVDASAASAFPQKWRRAVVGGAGIMVEMALAALAMIVWVNVEPGLVRAFAFNVMLIGGVSTVLFNGNPLLRFDGYYVLCDLVEIPNLGTRANRYIFYVIQRRLLGIEDAQSPVTAPGEAAWFVVYGLAAFAYRIVIILTIAMFIATKMFVVGVLLAMWALATMFVWQPLKGLRFLATSPKLRHRRRRAFTIAGAAVALLVVAVLGVRLPYATVAQGVVWTPEHATVRAGAEGVVTALLAQPGEEVTVGQPLVVLEDPTLAPRIAALALQVQELTLRLDAIRMVDQVQADMVREQIRHAEADLALAEQQRRDLTIRSGADGRFVVPKAADLPGRFLRRGDGVGYVLAADDTVVRVVVTQAQVDLVRHRTGQVDVRFVDRVDAVVPAVIRRAGPAAVDELPSAALATIGGGAVALDPQHADRRRALESLFEFDLGIAGGRAQPSIGGRVYVRFDHGWEPVAFRIARALRQLFLSRFDV